MHKLNNNSNVLTLQSSKTAQIRVKLLILETAKPKMG